MASGAVVLAVVVVILILGFSISSITMGALHLGDCPAEYHIPEYLIVSGSLPFLALLSLCEAAFTENVIYTAVTGGLTMVGWFIAGSVWIYDLHHDYSTNPEDWNYCNETLYLFAFWITTTEYILLAILLILVICGFTGTGEKMIDILD